MHAVVWFDRMRIDDPVGAVSVHLVCGIWGTLAVGLFGAKAGVHQLLSQIVGVVAVGGFTVVLAGLLFLGLKMTTGLRVDEGQEAEGARSERARHGRLPGLPADLHQELPREGDLGRASLAPR